MQKVGKGLSLISDHAALKIALIYILVSGVWIAFSDQMLLWFVREPQFLTWLQSVKGWFFVLVTAILLGWLSQRFSRELVQRTKLLENIITHIPMYVYWKDREGNYLGCNQRFASIAGCGSREEIVGLNDYDLEWNTVEADLMRLTDCKVMEKHEGKLDFEEVRSQADGESATFLTSVVPFEDDAGSIYGVLGVSRDVTLQKQKERALKQSVQRFQTLAALAPVGIFQTDAKGACTYVNERWRQLSGLSETEALGVGWKRALYVDDRERVFAEWSAAASAGKPFLSEYRFQTPAGEVYWLVGRAEPLFDETGTPTGYLGALTDITEQKKAEMELRESEERFRSIFESAATPMAIIAPDYRFLKVNAALCRMLGYSAAEFTQLSVADVIHPDDLEESLRDFTQLSTGEKMSYDADKRCQHKSGKVVWGHTSLAAVRDVSGELLYFVGLTEDITEKMVAEEGLKESERKLSTLMGNLPGMAYRCLNDPNWTMEFISSGCLALTGYPASDLINNRRLPFAELIVEEDREMIWEEVQKALQEQREYTIEYRIRSADGNLHWVWEQGVGILDETRKLLALEGFIIDITTRKQAEESLLANDRMKSEFISTVAHEFRTPLTSIQGFSQLLLEDKEVPSEIQSESLTYIYERTTALAELVTELLDISRVEAGYELSVNREACAVAELRHQFRTFVQAWDNKHQITIHLQAENTQISIDRVRIGQVLENLLSNAMKYSANGSKIELQGMLQDGHYQFSVRDQGVGMSPAQVDKVFEKFYRVDASDAAVEGIGLGMNIVKHIIEAHTGEVWVESEPGSGTTVNFTVPLADQLPGSRAG